MNRRFALALCLMLASPLIDAAWAAQGVSPRALAALDGLTPNPQVIALDHRQGVFRQSFEQFANHRIAERLAKAQRMMQTYAPVLQRIERQFGVPGSIVI